MRSYEFREEDGPGLETLGTISDAHRFNHWMYSAISPYCKGRILEIGSGIGNISSRFLYEGRSLFMTDIRSGYCDRLRKDFGRHHATLGIAQMDVADPEFDQKFDAMSGTFDTVFALNVVEHIHDEGLALRNAKKLLATGGHFVILVPAYQALYNKLDTTLGHYRRYSGKTLRALLARNGFEVIHSRYFNALGILGWFISGKLQGNRTIPNTQMKVFEAVVPLARLLDSILIRQVGLSVIAVGRK